APVIAGNEHSLPSPAQAELSTVTLYQRRVRVNQSRTRSPARASGPPVPALGVTEQALERSSVIGYVAGAGPQGPRVDGLEADPPEAFGDLAAAAASYPDVQGMV